MLTAMPPMETPTQRLANMLLGQPVRAWITERRTQGSSWRTIAADLRSATNGQIDVSHEAIRQWAEDVAA